MIYQSTEPTIVISVIVLKNNGTPDIGKFPELYLYRTDIPTLILNGVIMTESLDGLYQYTWTHGLGLDVNYTYTYYIKDGSDVVGGDSFRIVNMDHKTNENISDGEGRAV